MIVSPTPSQRAAALAVLSTIPLDTTPAHPAWGLDLWVYLAEVLWDRDTQTSSAGLTSQQMEMIRALPLDSCVGDTITWSFKKAWQLSRAHSKAFPDGDQDSVTLALYLSAFEQGCVALFA